MSKLGRQVVAVAVTVCNSTGEEWRNVHGVGPFNTCTYAQICMCTHTLWKRISRISTVQIQSMLSSDTGRHVIVYTLILSKISLWIKSNPNAKGRCLLKHWFLLKNEEFIIKCTWKYKEPRIERSWKKKHEDTHYLFAKFFYKAIVIKRM